jgi:hypothetical protein
MAWLSNLAGRAEAFLENLDQAAATSLDKVGIASPQKQTQDYLQEKEMLRKEEAKSFMTSDSFLGPSRPIQAHTKQTSGSVAPNSPTEKKLSDVLKDTSKSDVDEDKLFAFLNSPTTPKSSSPAFGGKKPTRRSAPPKHQTPTRMKSPTTTLKEDTDGFPRRKTSDKSRSSSTSKMPEDHTTVQAHLPTDVQPHPPVDQPHPPVDQPHPPIDLRSHTPVDPETHPPSGHRTHPPVDHQTHPLTGSKSNTANTTSQVSTPQSKSPINNVSSPFQPSWLDAFQDTSVMDNGEEHDSQDGVDTRVREGEPIAQPQPSDGNQPYSVDDCRVDDVGVGGGGVDDRRVDDGGVGGGSVGDGGVGGDGVGDDDVKGRVKDEVEDPELTEMRVKLSNLELENQLLRREISSLNEEMSSTGSRLKHLQDSNARYQQEIMLSKERISSLENDLLVSTSALEDANANYSTKCEEFDFLSQKMSIAEQEMKTAKESLLQTTAENSRLVQDASDISGAHHSALNSLRQQLSTAQQNLTRETQAHQKIKDALEEGKRSLSEELAVVKEELRKSQQVLSERTVADGQLNEKLSATLGNYECLQKEYQEYKHKATTILQAKSQEITKLKSDSRGPPEALEEVQLEKDLLEDKLAKYEVMISDLQGEAKTIEEGAEAEISRLEASLAVAKENLVREQNSHSELQLEMGRLKSELDQSRMELLQQSSALTAKIKVIVCL